MGHRMKAVTIAKLLSFILASYWIPIEACVNVTPWTAFGLKIDLKALQSMGITYLLMHIFYLGELIGNFMVFFYLRHNTRNRMMQFERTEKPNPWSAVLHNEYDRLYQFFIYNPTASFRNIFFAPVSEELVFRGIIVTSIYIATVATYPNWSNEKVVFRTAWSSIGWFGVAHLHHWIEKLRSGDGLRDATISSIVQLTYTSIFGLIAAFLFLRTGSILAPITSHIICNFVGLPDTGFLQPPPNHYQRMGCNYPYRYVLLVLHIAGLVSFYFLLFPLTEGFVSGNYFYKVHH